MRLPRKTSLLDFILLTKQPRYLSISILLPNKKKEFFTMLLKIKLYRNLKLPKAMQIKILAILINLTLILKERKRLLAGQLLTLIWISIH